MTPETQDAVALDGLTVAYGPAVVLDQIRLRVPAGSALAVVGANGTHCCWRATATISSRPSARPHSTWDRRGSRWVRSGHRQVARGA